MQEVIPDADTIYCRVHRTHIDNRKADIERIKPSAFDPTPYKEPNGLSVNWSRYSDAQSTKDGVVANGKNPDDFGVVSFVVEKVRGIPLGVIHDPVYEPVENKAHSLLLDIPPRSANDAKKVLLLRSICKIEIDVN
jgi:hypothetical protein